MKTCSRCNNSKSLDDFYASKRTNDGRHRWCKFCCADRKRERRMGEDRDAILARERQQAKAALARHRAANPLPLRPPAKTRTEINAAYRERHKEAIGLRHAHWLRENPNRRLEAKARHAPKARAHKKEQRDQLDETYVRQILARNLFNMTGNDLPKPLIEAHQALLNLKRELRKYSHEKC